VIELRSVEKVYKTESSAVVALHDINIHIGRGEFLAVTGPSGSGKSTLLNLIGCLDRPTSGFVLLDGDDTTALNDGMLSRLRNRSIGFIFQMFNLIPELTLAENVELPLVYAGLRRGRRERVLDALARVGMVDRANHRAGLLSGGEQQRVAIARALVNDPELIVADEPTGSIDAPSAVQVLSILRELHEQGRTVVLVTHNAGVAAVAERALRLNAGMLAGAEPDAARSHPLAPPSVGRRPVIVPDAV
jgi:putative ABC transport system ATP-binding protein